MTYLEFLHEQEMYPDEVALKDYDNMTDLLLEDIRLPSFLSDVSRLKYLYLFQGSHFVDRPHYTPQEQILCAIDGAMSVGIVPHVYR